ncbi:MAG: SPOR domain-containing protein, partial [Phormidium sp. GEM2.Bin31]
EAGLGTGVSVVAAESSESSESEDAGERRLTALGVGSVLLFLAATATLGYVLVNPESLSQLGLERFFARETAAEGDGEDTTTSSETGSRPTRLPTSPDLAAEEFVQLDLSTLSRLDPETRSPLVTPPPTPEDPSPAAATAPTPSEPTEPAENTLDNISALLTPEATDESQAPASDSPTETPEASQQTATEESSDPPPTIDRDANYGGFIFVVVDYNNQVSTLERVREQVPDAYLREFPDGVKVQVGAFDDIPSAESLVNRLQEDGISARVYQAR